ncbi:hypothetical protein HMPREF0204_13476 [Chryseobacterium gleum ATCC 35910]|uniref:Uncharacterized protein n=1 Tax=Chryseobacterium gleum ATCC 35910 TaxID=525257 RepID=A0ABN0AMW9_CHRGE|nr:hypothetical protein HMPREF0204_13476 [Chryseobacterium gleum ATCC 35910]
MNKIKSVSPKTVKEKHPILIVVITIFYIIKISNIIKQPEKL